MKIYNHDLFALVKRLRRFKFELSKSISSNLGEANSYDMNRLGTYLDALEAFKGWMVSQPELDLPESSPMELEVQETPELPEVDNDDLAVIINLMNLIEIELMSSQSARRSTGMIVHDQERFDAMALKIRAFIADYMSQSNPLDLPESLPVAPMTGHGRTGV